jgi:ATP-binding cassette subfamily B protein
VSAPLLSGLEEEALGKAYDGRLLARLWPYIQPYRWQVLATLLLVGPVFFAELLPAWIIKQSLEQAQGIADPDAPFGLPAAPGGFNPFIWLAMLYALTTLAQSGLQYANMVLMSTTGQSAMRDVRAAVFDHIQSLHLGFFDSYPVGRLVTRATNDVENVAEMFSAGIVALITDVLKMLGFAVVLFLVHAKLALFTFAVVPLLLVAAILFRLKVREAFRMVRVRIARINTVIQETIVGMKVVQLFTREDRNFRDFDELNASHRDAWKMSIRYDALLFSAVEVAQNLTVTIIVWYGTGIAEVGVIYVFIDWMRRFFMPLRDLSAKYSVMQSSMASAERIFQLLDLEPEIADPARPKALPAASGQGGSVEFENVWFSYRGEPDAAKPDEPVWVLKDLSFRVEPGEKVAFVGATGAGKTTLIKLLTRMHDVTRGRVTVDGIDVRDLAQRELRRRVGTVLQDVALFSGTVADNISLGRPEIDAETVLRSARAVRADGFISALRKGYDSTVRERGSNFSAGQRQLLSFARALAHGPEILVLDEATSSIDSETEALIQQGIHVLMERQTSIAIAHRLSTIRDVDRIYVLEGGALAEIGSHDELIARGGVYARLHELQYEPERAVASAGLASA